MPDAADRIRLDAKAPPRAKRRGWTRAFAPKNPRTIAGAALAAMMIGIVVNALALQHGHRLDLVPAAKPVAAVSPPAPAAPTPRPETAAMPEPPRPPQTTVAMAEPPKSGDAIADFLRAQQSSDKRKLTLAAQGALAGLGFSVKPTGALDAPTRSALVAFEKSRHLPVSTEITPKLVHALKAAKAAG